MLKKLKSYMMPLAMTTGIIFHNYVSVLAFLIPYLIFIMLLFTYTKLSLKNIQFTKMHLWLIVVQIVGSVSVYFILNPINTILAQGVMICILAPTATAAPVIAGMLKGNIASLTAYSLISNFTVALFAPLFFSYIGYNELPFFDSVFEISKRVGFLLIIPFIAALLINKFLPKAGKYMQSKSGISFYLWSIALTVVTGRTVEFIIAQGESQIVIELAIAIGALVICVFQFWLGRRIGRKLDDTVAGGQGLGQKNTVLAIWMAQIYLNPLSSIGPGAYVLWQNSVNSWQIWRQRRNY
jgi:BASS family bile acid:Na+ symporter